MLIDYVEFLNDDYISWKLFAGTPFTFCSEEKKQEEIVISVLISNALIVVHMVRAGKSCIRTKSTHREFFLFFF